MELTHILFARATHYMYNGEFCLFFYLYIIYTIAFVCTVRMYRMYIYKYKELNRSRTRSSRPVEIKKRHLALLFVLLCNSSILHPINFKPCYECHLFPTEYLQAYLKCRSIFVCLYPNVLMPSFPLLSDSDCGCLTPIYLSSIQIVLNIQPNIRFCNSIVIFRSCELQFNACQSHRWRLNANEFHFTYLIWAWCVYLRVFLFFFWLSQGCEIVIATRPMMSTACTIRKHLRPRTHPCHLLLLTLRNCETGGTHNDPMYVF